MTNKNGERDHMDGKGPGTALNRVSTMASRMQAEHGNIHDLLMPAEFSHGILPG